MKIRHLLGQRWSILLFVLLLASPGALWAAETTSSIRGKILGSDGSPVANASVQVTDLRTGSSRTYMSNSIGTFLASRLPVGGPYRITVNGEKTVTVKSISLGDVYNLKIDISTAEIEEIVVYGESSSFTDIAAGPAATFSSYDLETAVSFNRDIVDVYGLDPRINIDNEDDGFEINCGGKHPRFNSVTLDGVSYNDRFGLNSNGYSTAVGMPFPYDAIQQVAVEMAPFDVTYGGFSACNINSVTKSGTNQWDGNMFYEYTNEDLRGDSIDGDPSDFSTPAFKSEKWGFSIGGPIIKDKLFIFAAYEETDKPRFLARGYAGSGNGEERPWLSKADYDRVVAIANNVYSYDPGGSPGDGVQEDEKYMVRVDWNINDNHSLALIYNYYDGFQDRDSDGDPNEFEFANHFYTKGAESITKTMKLTSHWTDAFSTELFISSNEMNDSQVTVGPGGFGDFQISINRDVIYLGADDSRQANKLNTESDFFRISAQYLVGDHVITVGYEQEELSIFNLFVQHSRGGEWDFFDDSGGNPAFCDGLSAQGRFDDPDCGMSGIDKFELGRPSRIYYGSGGGTNIAADASASFTNTLNSVFVQDEIYFGNSDLTIVAGLRYDWFTSKDRPKFNAAFTAANGIVSNENIDGLDLVMPRFGFTWGIRDDLTLRGGIGLYSGGNPNVWISNAWSNDGITNVQLRLNNFSGSGSVLDGSIPLTGSRPGFDVPQTLFDQVAATTAASASSSRLVLIDPGYKQPGEWKFAFGGTWQTPWYGIVADIDYLHTELQNGAQYVDLSQAIVGQTITGQPIYDYVNGRDNYMLTNTSEDSKADSVSIILNKKFDFGLDLMLGYAYTEAEDVVPMTSSVAGSNFDNLSTSDINNPSPATSNYLVPHRITLEVKYSTKLFGDLETRVTLSGYASEGQPQSYVMGSGDLEGDGFFGRHLLYVPGGLDDPRVVFESGFDTTAFFAFVDKEDLSAGFQERNENHVRWSNRFDLRIDQELPTFIDGTSAKLYLKIYNLGNLLSDKWGTVNDAQFFSVQVVNSSVNSQGQYVFERFNNRSIRNVLTSRTLWALRIGFEYKF